MLIKKVFKLFLIITCFPNHSFSDVIRLGRCPDVKLQKNFKYELVNLYLN